MDRVPIYACLEEDSIEIANMVLPIEHPKSSASFQATGPKLLQLPSLPQPRWPRWLSLSRAAPHRDSRPERQFLGRIGPD